MKVFIIFIFFSIYSFQLTLSNIDCANDYAVDDSYTNDNRQMTDRKNSDLRQMINKKNLEKRFFRKLKSVIELLKKNKNKKFDNAKAFYSRHKLPTKLNYTWPTNDYLDIYKQPRPITAAIIITEKPKDVSNF
uniref:Hypothetical secreted protein n=1 Tax=Glossina morsitans morsitans TaxID=37546 RepID=D3TLV5_GLOMM